MRRLLRHGHCLSNKESLPFRRPAGSARPATSSGTPTSPSARPLAGGASQAACSPPTATSSTTPARSSSISSRSSRTAEAGAQATIDGYDRSDGQATLSAAQPFQAADRLPAPPVRADGPDLLARRATRRSGHRRPRAAPAPAPRRRRPSSSSRRFNSPAAACLRKCRATSGLRALCGSSCARNRSE